MRLARPSPRGAIPTAPPAAPPARPGRLPRPPRRSLAGSVPSPDPAAARGLRTVRIVDIHDGELENTPEVRREIVRAIRQIKPQVVVTADPTTWFIGNRFMNHPDHRVAGATTLDALFPADGIPSYFP